jgi:hypothetical protein
MLNLNDKLNHIFKKNTVRTVFFYIASALLMHLDRFILGSNAIIRTHDHFNAYWPFQLALAQRIMNFQMPGWFPDYTGGMPFFMWDLNWLFFPMIFGSIFPEPWKITVITIMQFLLAGYGAHLFLQRFFDTDKLSSFLGGLLWAVSVFNLSYWRIFDLAAMPMLFYCTDRISFTNDKNTRLLLLGGLLICATNIWFIKSAPFIALFHLFFILFVHKAWKERKNVLVAYSLFWTFLFLLNLPMIVSLIANASESNRSLMLWEARDTSLSAMFNNILSFIGNPIHSSSVNLGFVASLLVFFALSQFKRWSRLAKMIFYYYISILFIAEFVIYSSLFLAFWHSLPISGFRLYKIILIGPFVYFILAITNFKGFLKFLSGPLRNAFMLIFITAIILCIYHFKRNVFPSNYIEVFVVLLFATITFITIILLRKKGAGTGVYIVLFMALIFSERFVYFNLMRPADYQPPSFTHFFSSDLFDRFRPVNKHDYRIAFINWHPAVGLYNGYQVAGGYNAAYPKRYVHFWDAIMTGETESKIFSSYFHRAYLLDEKVKVEASPPHRIKQLTFSTDLLALHNVRYIFSFNEIENPGRWGLSLAHQGIPAERAPGLKRGLQVLRRIFEPIPYYVYEIDGYLPRVFTSGSYEIVDGQESLKEYLRGNGVNALKEKVAYDRKDLTPADFRSLIELQDALPANDNRKRNAAKLPQVTYYSDNKIIVKVVSPSPQQLVVNENYSRDWTATVNGYPAAILPAYGVFRSVILDKGKNEVVFEYRPSYLVMSLWVSGLGSVAFLAVCLGWAFIYRKPEGMEL